MFDNHILYAISRVEDCLELNILEIQLQTVFYPGYSVQNITSVQAPVLGKKNILADKADNNVLYHIAS